MEISHLETVACDAWHHVEDSLSIAVVMDGGFTCAAHVTGLRYIKAMGAQRDNVTRAVTGSIVNVMETREAADGLFRDLKSSSVVSTLYLLVRKHTRGNTAVGR